MNRLTVQEIALKLGPVRYAQARAGVARLDAYRARADAEVLEALAKPHPLDHVPVDRLSAELRALDFEYVMFGGQTLTDGDLEAMTRARQRLMLARVPRGDDAGSTAVDVGACASRR